MHSYSERQAGSWYFFTHWSSWWFTHCIHKSWQRPYTCTWRFYKAAFKIFYIWPTGHMFWLNTPFNNICLISLPYFLCVTQLNITILRSYWSYIHWKYAGLRSPEKELWLLSFVHSAKNTRSAEVVWWGVNVLCHNVMLSEWTPPLWN